jgi:hypothetical protein
MRAAREYSAADRACSKADHAHVVACRAYDDAVCACEKILKDF